MGELELATARGKLVVHTWDDVEPHFLVLLSHGYGEHARRYDHVAAALVGAGAVVYAPDHHGHGRSDGERALAEDLEAAVDDLHTVAEQLSADHPGPPMVLIGHSMGGLIATRYAQRHGDELTALVLSGPAIGANPDILALAQMDPIPNVPIDPDALSRDPEVGRAYAEDPLVYHGPFRRETLESFGRSLQSVAEGGTFGDLPTLWVHGEDDPIVPLVHTRPAMEAVRGSHFHEKTYPGARHEIFNEINRDEVIADVLAFLDAHV